jgi:PmbA protein
MRSPTIPPVSRSVSGLRGLSGHDASAVVPSRPRPFYTRGSVWATVLLVLTAFAGGAVWMQSATPVATQQILPSFLQMQERPHLQRALASSPFDAEGVTTRDRDLVRDCVLQGYVLGSYSARKLGLRTTGNAGGIHNLLVQSSEGALSTEQLLRRMDRGLYVTEMMGQGVNGVTGDYSRGASGFWVEDGVIAYPVHEVTVAGNLRDMFQGVRALGSDVDTHGAIRTGSVLIDEVTIAGS